MRFGGLWRHRDFVRLWAGQTVSDFGSIIGLSAIPFTAIIALDATPLQIAALGVARIVPTLIIGLPAGVWVDRLRKRPVMIATDVARAAVLLSVPAAWAFDALRIEQLYVVAFATGGLTVFFQVAYRSYLPALVDQEELLEGNSKLSATSAVSEFAGFSVSGWLVQLFSGPIAILVDAFTFVFSAFCIRDIKSVEPPTQAHEDRPGIREETAEGLRAITRHPILRAIAASGLLHWTGFGVFGTVYSLFVIRELGFEPGVLGVIYGIGGISSFFGAILAERAAARLGVGPSMALGVAIMGFSMMLIVGAPAGVMGIAAAILCVQQLADGAFTAYDVNGVTLRQSVTAENMLGRVNAFMHVDEQGALLIGTVLGGVVGEALGLRTALFTGAALTVASGVLLWVSPVGRERRARSGALP
ncbi:MAG: MFS transporter [Dehalococcoidia bacterium]